MIVICKFTLSWSKECITISEKRALEVMTTQQFSDPRKNKSVRGSEIHVPRTHVTPRANQTGELWTHIWQAQVAWRDWLTVHFVNLQRGAASTYHCHYLCHFVLFDFMFCPFRYAMFRKQGSESDGTLKGGLSPIHHHLCSWRPLTSSTMEMESRGEGESTSSYWYGKWKGKKKRNSLIKRLKCSTNAKFVLQSSTMEVEA